MMDSKIGIILKKGNKSITFVHLTLKKLYKDQLKLKREIKAKINKKKEVSERREKRERPCEKNEIEVVKGKKK